jgi:hypothetical protein
VRGIFMKKNQVKRTPNFAMTEQDSSSAVVPGEGRSVKDRMKLEHPKKALTKKMKRAATHSITADNGAAQSGEVMTPRDQSGDVTTLHEKDQNEPKLVRRQTTTLAAKPTLLIEEGLTYRKIVRALTKGRKLVGTVTAGGSVKTKRRWFCCGRQALGAAEQQAIANAIPKQDEGIDKALEDTIRDRARRSQRNARFHRSRGVTPGVIHHGGRPDMDELGDGEMIEV